MKNVIFNRDKPIRLGDYESFGLDRRESCSFLRPNPLKTLLWGSGPLADAEDFGNETGVAREEATVQDADTGGRLTANPRNGDEEAGSCSHLKCFI